MDEDAVALISNKREFLARRMGEVGLVSLLERMARPGLVVLTYHRIGDPAGDAFYGPVFSATAARFREQLEAMGRVFRVVSLDEVVAHFAEGRPFERPSLLVTFDDGYRDNLELAGPLLRGEGMPAAMFVPSGYLDRPRLFWWDRVAYVVKQASAGRLVIEEPRRIELDLAGSGRRDDAVWAVVKAYLEHRGVDEEQEALRLLKHLEERAGVSVDAEGLGRRLFLGWEDLPAVREAGFAIGSHTHDHPRLGLCERGRQERELRVSKERLEAALGDGVEAVAYPFGTAEAVTAETTRMAKVSGYRVGFVAGAGRNQVGVSDPMRLTRVNVGYADSVAMLRARVGMIGALGRSWV